MTLHDFLIDKRVEILEASEKRVVALAALRPTSDQLKNGLPLFLDQLIEVLGKNLNTVGTQDELDISDCVQITEFARSTFSDDCCLMYE